MKTELIVKSTLSLVTTSHPQTNSQSLLLPPPQPHNYNAKPAHKIHSGYNIKIYFIPVNTPSSSNRSNTASIFHDQKRQRHTCPHHDISMALPYHTITSPHPHNLLTTQSPSLENLETETQSQGPNTSSDRVTITISRHLLYIHYSPPPY